ncbi:acyl-CoA dehydratase activase-related protein [Chloroflexota bacterium]
MVLSGFGGVNLRLRAEGKKVTIGIPRALSYYQYFPLWKTFFEELGAEVITSPVTSRVMIEEGLRRLAADTCLPVKVFMGHVVSLQGRCDYVFVPAIRSLRKNVYNCSKFLGLPDLVKAIVPEAPAILSLETDVSRGKLRIYQAVYGLGSCLTRNPSKIKRASLAALRVYHAYRELMSRQGLTPPEAISRMLSPQAGSPAGRPEPPVTKGTIALIGHPYLLYDNLINHRLIPYLEQTGHDVLTPDLVAGETLEAAVIEVMASAQWMCEDEIVGGGEYYLKSRVDGVINLQPFGCGPDSLMADVLRRRATYHATPFMNLPIDEHTSEVGILTRLEAFVDMIHRRKMRSNSHAHRLPTNG